MRKYSLPSSIGSLEELELKLSPVPLAVGLAAAPALLRPIDHVQGDDDDGPSDGNNDGGLMADSEPPRGGDPMDIPPVEYPVIPPSGPSGPGS